MKKMLFSASLIMMLWSCQKEEVSAVAEASNLVESTSQDASKVCGSQQLLEQQLKEDPAMAARMNKMEQFVANYAKNNPSAKIVDGKIQITVKVHVLYQNSTENVSWNQIQSQIDVLNNDFNALNADYTTGVPTFFQNKRANLGYTDRANRLSARAGAARALGHATATPDQAMFGRNK